MPRLPGRLTRLFTLALLSCISSTAAAELTVDFDPSRTTVAYVLGDVLHTVHGTFQLKSGHISFDPETAVISGQATVFAASGDSGSGARDRRMKRDILEIDRFPEIAFSPEKITGASSKLRDSSLSVSGSFSIHGQSHQITVPVHVRVSGPDVAVSAHFVVPYVAWGMKNPSTFLLRVDDYVDVSIDAAGKLK